MVQTANPLHIEYYIIHVKAQELHKYKHFNLYELSHSCLLRSCSHPLIFQIFICQFQQMLLRTYNWLNCFIMSSVRIPTEQRTKVFVYEFRTIQEESILYSIFTEQ